MVKAGWTRAWVLVLAIGCGDDGPADDAESGATTGATTTMSTTMMSTTAAESSSGESTAGGSCDAALCGTSCTPEMCIEGDCSAYACSQAGECLPRDDFACQDQIDACSGHSCGEECFLLCEDDSGDGACAATFCDPDGICVYEALFEMRPCPLGTGSSGGESGSSSG